MMRLEYGDDEEDQDIGPDIVVISRTWQIAKKEHDCQTCGDKINPGDQYQRSFYLLDGVATVHKQHSANCWQNHG